MPNQLERHRDVCANYTHYPFKRGGYLPGKGPSVTLITCVMYKYRALVRADLVEYFRHSFYGNDGITLYIHPLGVERTYK